MDGYEARAFWGLYWAVQMGRREDGEYTSDTFDDAND